MFARAAVLNGNENPTSIHEQNGLCPLQTDISNFS